MWYVAFRFSLFCLLLLTILGASVVPGTKYQVWYLIHTWYELFTTTQYRLW